MNQHARARLPLQSLLCVLLFAAGVSEPSNAASLSVSGNLDSSLARSYTLEELQALPGALNKTVGSDTYQGVSLWSLLGGSSSGSSGIIPVGTVNNSILRSFVSATGSDGARSLISVGEINPRFGGLGDPVLVAFSKNGTVLPAPVLVDAEDASQTRNIANLASLEVSSLPQPSTGAPGGPSTQLALTGVTLPATFDLAALQALPATTLTGISFNSGPAFDYTGVKLWDLLNLGGIDAAAIARGYVLARATDDVSVFFALGEIDPLSRGPQDILIAYDRSSGGLGTAGFARVVVPGDDRGGRYLSNVVALEVGYIQAVPEAQTWILMIVGLGMVAFLARRRISRQ